MTGLYFRWIIIQLRSSLRNISFYLMTSLLAVVFILLPEVVGNVVGTAEILICPGKTECGSFCTDRLTGNPPDGFVFFQENDPDRLIKMVITNEVSCGVIFERDGSEGVMSAEDGASEHAGSVDSGEVRVIIYQSEGVTDGYVVREILYPYIAAFRAPAELKQYVGSVQALSGVSAPETAEYAAERYEKYYNGMELSIYELRQPEGAERMPEDGYGSTSGNRTGEKRGRLLVYIISVFAMTLLMILDTSRTDRAFYSALRLRYRVILVMGKVAVKIIMSTILAILISFIL